MIGILAGMVAVQDMYGVSYDIDLYLWSGANLSMLLHMNRLSRRDGEEFQGECARTTLTFKSSITKQTICHRDSCRWEESNNGYKNSTTAVGRYRKHLRGKNAFLYILQCLPFPCRVSENALLPSNFVMTAISDDILFAYADRVEDKVVIITG